MTPDEFDVLYDRFLAGRLTPEEGERLRECLADPLWKRRWRDLSDLDGMLADEFQGPAKEVPQPAPARRAARARAGRASPVAFRIAAAAAAVVLAGLAAWLAVGAPRPAARAVKPPPDTGTEEAARREYERLEDTQRKIEEHLAALERRRQHLASETEAKPPAPAEDESRRRELDQIEVDRKTLEEEMARTVEAARRAWEKLERPEEPPREPAPGETAAAVARLGRVQGGVTVLSAGGEIPPREGREILPGEGIRASGLAEVLFIDGTRLELAAETTVSRIEGPRVALERGSLSAEVARRPPGRPFVFSTPHAEARVLGTRLSLAVTAEATRLEVRQGRVRLKRLRDGASVDVAAGHEAAVNGRGPLASKPLPALAISFQDGVSPTPEYAGTRDVSISRVDPARNLGASATLGADGDDQGKDIFALLRWDLLEIPPASRVLSAEIALYVTGDSGGDAYKLYEMKRAWSESEATWRMASAGHSWQGSGARAGGDRGAIPLGSIAATEKGERTIPLNAAGVAAVQSWVNAPASNFGLIIAESANRNGLDFGSREAPTPSRRPKLTVTYVPAERR